PEFKILEFIGGIWLVAGRRQRAHGQRAKNRPTSQNHPQSIPGMLHFHPPRYKARQDTPAGPSSASNVFKRANQPAPKTDAPRGRFVSRLRNSTVPSPRATHGLSCSVLFCPGLQIPTMSRRRAPAFRHGEIRRGIQLTDSYWQMKGEAVLSL